MYINSGVSFIKIGLFRLEQLTEFKNRFFIILPISKLLYDAAYLAMKC